MLIHGGPFANIAHGCNSITATRTALRLADYTVTEAGFASELGAEKFFNITCRVGEFAPRAAVLVVTLRAYKIHGMDNILKHVENIRLHGIPAIISINRFLDDDEQELIALKAEIEGHEIPVSITDFREAGGNGGIELAHLLVDACEAKQPFCHLYELEMPLKEKIQTICTKIYGADGVSFAKGLITRMRRLEQEGYGTLPVCMAKTQMSLTDNPKTTGRPKGFTISVTRIEVKAGAGFIVVYTGEVMTMPGLPKVPSACSIDITAEGTISGLF